MGLAICSEPWWLYEVHGPYTQETEDLFDIREQVLTEHPGRCPSMNSRPLACEWCESHYKDKYFLWRLTMTMDQPYDAENNPTV